MKHSVIVITFMLAHSDPINRLTVFFSLRPLSSLQLSAVASTGRQYKLNCQKSAEESNYSLTEIAWT